MTTSSDLAASGFANHGGRAEPEIRTQGHSGCAVKLIREGGHVFVEKSSQDPSYNSRLSKQIQKQKALGASNRLPFVRIPKILQEADHGGLTSARMEYVYFLDSIDYFAAASIVGVDAVASMIVAYIDAEIAESEIVEVPGDLFGNKLDEIERSLTAIGKLGIYENPIQTLRRMVREGGPIELPMGRCHGDLTFSNIMIASDSRAISLIDFLDSFIESPIIDIAKVRQDSRFCWSLLMASREVDPVRFRMVMRYIDARICEHYSGLDWYSRNIGLVLALNLLRIAPYAKRQDVHEFLVDAIRQLELRR